MEDEDIMHLDGNSDACAAGPKMKEVYADDDDEVQLMFTNIV